ncbi:MAG: gliding motility lipoprotein GldH, partial [Phocaeicola sp.]
GLLTLVSCQISTVYHTYQPVPSTGWGKYDTLFYTPMVTAGEYEVEIALRHHEKYPYQNLWVELSYLLSDSVQLPKDSVAFTLTDKEGMWNGVGVSSLYQYSCPDKLKLKVAEGDTLREIRMIHLMRNTPPLLGITDLGICIERVR